MATTEIPTTKYRLRGALDFLLAQKQDDLSVRQLSVLLACRKGKQTVRGLAEQFGVHKPAVVRAANRLTEKGLMKREPDPDDRRSIFLLLTGAGKAFAANFE